MWHPRSPAGLLAAIPLLLAACATQPAPAGGEGTAGETAAPEAAPPPEPAPPAPAPPPVPEPRTLTLVAGGDVSFGRELGQTLLREPEHDFFEGVASLFASADARFVNLESQLSDQRGETQSPWVRLVFTGPPQGAAALARARVDIVSLANNHAWDYGKTALLETLDNLDSAGVAHAGTGRTRDEAYAPAVFERSGVRVALLAVTDIWNQGSLRKHKAAEHVAGAGAESLTTAVRAARAREDVDLVLVSHHGGVEFLDLPLTRTRDLLHAAIDAGADAVIGHHPHVAQGIEWYRGKPILYSLGNLVMEMSEGRPKPNGYLARLRFRDGSPPELSACPLRFVSHAGRSLVGHPGRALLEKRFFDRLERVSRSLGGVAIGEAGEDGCAKVEAAASALAGAAGQGPSVTSGPRPDKHR